MKPYQDEGLLRELYIEEELSTREIADRLDTSNPTISRYLRKYGIETRTPDTDTERLSDRRWMEQKYVEEELPQHEIAELCDTTQGNVSLWLDKHGIVGFNKYHKPTGPVPFCTDPWHGYERWRNRHGEEAQAVRIHRLIAVAEWGFDAVCGMDVHHKNEVPWDNRAENLELMSRSEHVAHHNRKGVSVE